MIDQNKISVCLSVCLSTPTGCSCVGVWQLYDASKREVSTQTRLSMEPHASGWCVGDWLHDLMFCGCMAIGCT